MSIFTGSVQSFEDVQLCDSHGVVTDWDGSNQGRENVSRDHDGIQRGRTRLLLVTTHRFALAGERNARISLSTIVHERHNMDLIVHARRREIWLGIAYAAAGRSSPRKRSALPVGPARVPSGFLAPAARAPPTFPGPRDDDDTRSAPPTARPVCACDTRSCFLLATRGHRPKSGVHVAHCPWKDNSDGRAVI